MMYIFWIYWNIVWWFIGVDEATIIDILTKRTNAQRQQIKAAYQQAKGKVKYIQTKLNFHTEYQSFSWLRWHTWVKLGYWIG